MMTEEQYKEAESFWNKKDAQVFSLSSKGGCGRNPGPNEVINRRRSRTCIPTKND